MFGFRGASERNFVVKVSRAALTVSAAGSAAVAAATVAATIAAAGPATVIAATIATTADHYQFSVVTLQNNFG